MTSHRPTGTGEGGSAPDGSVHDGSAQAHLAALRHRLYGPSATEADRLEYAELVARLQPHAAGPEPHADEPDEPDEPEEPGASVDSVAPPVAPPASRRRSRTVVIGIAGAVVVAALAVAATQAARSLSTPPTARPAPTWLASPTAVAVATPAVLAAGGRRLQAQQTSGGGSAVVRLDVRAAPRTGGRFVVALTSSDPAPVGWLAERPRPGSSRPGSVELVASGPPALRVGAAAPTTVVYSGAPPSLLVVQAPTGTGWTVTVAFTTASTSTSMRTGS